MELEILKETIEDVPWRYAEIVREEVEVEVAQLEEAARFMIMEAQGYALPWAPLMLALGAALLYAYISEWWCLCRRVSQWSTELSLRSTEGVCRSVAEAMQLLPWSLNHSSVSAQYLELQRRCAEDGHDEASKIAQQIRTVRSDLRSQLERFKDNPELAIAAADILLHVLRKSSEYTEVRSKQRVQIGLAAEEVLDALRIAKQSGNEPDILRALSIAETHGHTHGEDYNLVLEHLESLHCSEDALREQELRVTAAKDVEALSRMFTLQKEVPHADQAQYSIQPTAYKSLKLDPTAHSDPSDGKAFACTVTPGACVQYDRTGPLEPVLQAMHEQTRLVAAMASSQWLLEAYRVQRECENSIQKNRELRNSERKRARERALIIAKQEKAGREQQMVAQQIAAQSNLKHEHVACTLDLTAIEDLRRQAQYALGIQQLEQHRFERRLLVLVCFLNIAVFVGWYVQVDHIEPWHRGSPVPFASALLRNESATVMKGVLQQSWTHLCDCLEGVHRSMRCAPREPTRYHAVEVLSSTATGVNLRPGFHGHGMEEQAYTYVGSIGSRLLYSCVRTFGVTSMLDFPKALACAGRLLVRLCLPICISYAFKLFGCTSVSLWIFLIGGIFCLRTPLLVAVGPAYPVFVLLILQSSLLLIVHFLTSKLRWVVPPLSLSKWLGFALWNYRPAVIMCVTPVLSLWISYLIAVRASSVALSSTCNLPEHSSRR